MKKILSALAVILVLCIVLPTVSVTAANIDLAQTGAASSPTIKSADATKTGIRISWKSYPKAVKYRVFFRRSDFYSWKKLADTTALYYDHKNVPLYTEYHYTVRAMDKSGKYISGNNKNGRIGLRFRDPVITKLENAAEGVKLTVSPVSKTNTERMLTGDPQRYAIFVKGGSYGTSWKKIATGSGSTIMAPIDPKNSGKKLAFTVRHISSDGDFRSYFNAGKSITHIAAPKFNVAAVKSGQQITVEKVAGAAKYRVFVRDSSKKWKKVGDTTSSIVNKNVKYKNAYCYTVRAMNAAGKYISGFYANAYSADYVATPKKLKTEPSLNAIMLTWQDVDGAYQYMVFRKSKSSGNQWKAVNLDLGAFFVDYDVEPGEQYAYTVRCVDRYGHYASYYDTVGVEATYYGTPQVCISDNWDDGIALAWDELENVPKYLLFIDNDGEWQAVADTTEGFYLYGDVQENKTYKFTVRGLDASGKYCTGNYGGYDVTYRRNAPTTYDEAKLTATFHRDVNSYGINRDIKEKQYKYYIVDTACYGENGGDITENMIRLGQQNIRAQLDILEDTFRRYEYNIWECGYSIEKEPFEDGYAYYLYLDLSGVNTRN